MLRASRLSRNFMDTEISALYSASQSPFSSQPPLTNFIIRADRAPHNHISPTQPSKSRPQRQRRPSPPCHGAPRETTIQIAHRSPRQWTERRAESIRMSPLRGWRRRTQDTKTAISTHTNTHTLKWPQSTEPAMRVTRADGVPIANMVCQIDNNSMRQACLRWMRKESAFTAIHPPYFLERAEETHAAPA